MDGFLIPPPSDSFLEEKKPTERENKIIIRFCLELVEKLSIGDSSLRIVKLLLTGL